MTEITAGTEQQRHEWREKAAAFVQGCRAFDSNVPRVHPPAYVVRPDAWRRGYDATQALRAEQSARKHERRVREPCAVCVGPCEVCPSVGACSWLEQDREV